MGKGSNTTTTQSSSSPDPQAYQAYSQLLQRAQGVASTPYQAYTGELTAPVNAQQQAGISNINANANFAQPYIQQAAGLATNAANPLTAAQIAQYQNPYTQSVVNATQAQFNNQNQQAQQGLTSNAIAQGALGGNRTGVAAANLANQQQLAQAPTIAGLYNQSYLQGLQTAQQQFQQNPLAAAGAIANFGISGQGAALSGAGAQLGAGTLQQQTEQARNNALYQQYQQAQAYPYQQAQWLAGIDTGVGSNMGGTSSGQTTAPAPNPWGQILGAAMTAASFIPSDRRVKEAIEKIGSTHDGQPLYRYRYKGSSDWHIGPMAQDVEKSHPDAVQEGVGGVKYVNLKAATDDSVKRALGGGVGSVQHLADGGVSGIPWSGGVGWIPSLQIHGGSGAPHASAPSAPQQPSFDPSKLAQGISGIGSKSGFTDTVGSWFNPEAYGGADGGWASAYGGSSTNPLPGLSAADYGEGFARGGVVGYADGGAPDFSDRFAPAVEQPFGEMTRGQGIALASKTQEPIQSRGLPPEDDVVNPGDPIRLPDEKAMQDWRNSTPLPGVAGAPVAAKDDNEEETPANATPISGAGVAPAAYKPPYEITAADYMPPAKEPEDTGWLSKNARIGLLTAGLGMLANRSPFLGTAIGEGGLAGLSAYGSAEERDRKAAEDAQKLSLEAKKAANDLAHQTFVTNETVRHNKATEANAADKAPSGYQKNADGTLVFIKGGPHDPDVIAAETKARTKKGEEIDDDTVDAYAQRVAQGDTRALIGLGRNPTAITQIGKRVAEIFKEQGLSHEEGAKAILANIADQAGRMTAERTQAGIASKLAVYGRNVDNAIGVATKASEDVNRTGFVPVNKAINAYRTNTGDPKTVALGQALYTLINEYARAIGGGHGTVHDKEEAEQKLNQAYSHEQLVAIMNVMRQEIAMTKKSLPEARQEMRELYGRPSSETMRPGSAVPETTAVAPSFTPPPGALAQTHNGKTYYYDPVTKKPYPGQ